MGKTPKFKICLEGVLQEVSPFVGNNENTPSKSLRHLMTI
jgi:hypothetical protein